jgi:transcriptional regulator with XRE-family HTH domain
MTVDPARAGRDRINLAEALRDLRKASGLSGERLAARCRISQSKISRIETGHLLPSIVDVDRILTALDINAETKSDLLALARVANTEYQDIRSDVRRGIRHVQGDLAALEAEAVHMRHFLPAMITGLLQVPEYVRPVLSRRVRPAEVDTQRAIGLKLERQSILHDESKQFEFLFTEQALRWRVCKPAVMALQLEHVVSVSRLPSVRVGALPHSTVTNVGPMHTFVTYDQRLVTAELFTGSVALRDPKDVEFYGELFEYFAGHALWGDEARKFIAGQADAFRQM